MRERETHTPTEKENRYTDKEKAEEKETKRHTDKEKEEEKETKRHTTREKEENRQPDKQTDRQTSLKTPNSEGALIFLRLFTFLIVSFTLSTF